MIMKILIDHDSITSLIPINHEFDSFRMHEDIMPGERVYRFTLRPDLLSFDDDGSVLYNGERIGHTDIPLQENDDVTIKEIHIGSYKEAEYSDEEGDFKIIKHKCEEPYILCEVVRKAPSEGVVKPDTHTEILPSHTRDIRFVAGGVGLVILGGLISAAFLALKMPPIIGFAVIAVGGFLISRY